MKKLTIEEAFKAGWLSGYYDGGEHDCRIFEPTAELAWEDFKREQAEYEAAPFPRAETKG